MRMYAELAPWFHLLTAPADYEEEATIYAGLIEQHANAPVRTLLELGSGGGNNASHYKRQFAPTLVDLSPEMLRLSQTINPELEHIQGDMRSVRLRRTFDAVFIHDAIGYMTTESDLAEALATARAHLVTGGVALFVPDETAESFKPETDCGGHDGEDQGLRYLEWTHAPGPGETSYVVDYIIAISEGGREPRVFQDRHTIGLFPEATWFRLLREAGFEPASTSIQGSDWTATAFIGKAVGD